MLSRFNLKPSVSIEAFRTSYKIFCEQMQDKGLIVMTGEVGEREAGTPMDTDDKDAPKYYSVMSFKDREQLDAAYAHIAKLDDRDKAEHVAVHEAVLDPVFTCWRDIP